MLEYREYVVCVFVGILVGILLTRGYFKKKYNNQFLNRMRQLSGEG